MSELTAREKITKFCKIAREAGREGDLLLYGHHKHRMSKKLDKMDDAECEKVVKLMELDAFIVKRTVKDEAKAQASSKKVARLVAQPCGCGCGVTTRPGSKFKPGHDMKLKSVLRKAAAAGDAKAQKELKARGWA